MQLLGEKVSRFMHFQQFFEFFPVSRFVMSIGLIFKIRTVQIVMVNPSPIRMEINQGAVFRKVTLQPAVENQILFVSEQNLIRLKHIQCLCFT